MLQSKPEYLVFVCPNCVEIKHLRPKGDGGKIYSCPTCGLEFDYIDGNITKRSQFDRRGMKRDGY